MTVMKKILPVIMLLMTAGAAEAGGLVTKFSSSVQLSVDAAQTTVNRVGSSYSISGNGVNTTDGTTAGTISTGAITSGVLNPGNISATQATDGNSFSFSQSFIEADAIPASAPTIGTVSNLTGQVSSSSGVAGSLAGTVGIDGALTVTAGGAGTTAIGQFVSEITVID